MRDIRVDEKLVKAGYDARINIKHTQGRPMRYLLPLALLPIIASAQDDVPPLTQVLSQNHKCSDTIEIRSESLSMEQLTQACKLLSSQEAEFHRIFKTQNSPVKDD